MARYFIEVSYDGAPYVGFQIQQQSQPTVQGALEKALCTLYRAPIVLTGASRTDAGVHAHQNFLHFDTNIELEAKQLYNLNALLPNSIVVKQIYQVPNEAHARFDALKRSYIYRLHTVQNPFLEGRSWYYPFPIKLSWMNQAAASLLSYTDFESFSKKNVQLNSFDCSISAAFWEQKDSEITFHISSNRFLRGMIRGLVGTILQVGRGQITLDQWHEIVLSKHAQRADFSTPAYGLYLSGIEYPDFLKKLE